MQKSSTRNVLMWIVCTLGFFVGVLLFYAGWTEIPTNVGKCLIGTGIVILSVFTIALFLAEHESWKAFLEAASNERLKPKKTIELIMQTKNYPVARRIVYSFTRDRIKRSGNYTWGLAFWTKALHQEIGFAGMRWLFENIHAELGMQLHKEFDRVTKFLREHPNGLSSKENQAFVMNLIKKELTMMLEVCGEEKPYESIIPILASTSPYIQEQIFQGVRQGREFPKDVELTEEMISRGNEAYQRLISQLEKEVKKWPVTEAIF